MWWIVGLVIGIIGIADEILKSLQQEVAVERKRWEDSYQQVLKEIIRQQSVIEQKLRENRALLKYAEISDLHSASIKLADLTHSLFEGSRKTLDAMGRAIVNTAVQRKTLEQRKRSSYLWEKDNFEKQIVSLHKLRDEILIPDKNKVKTQRDNLLAEVRRLNKQTAELRDLKKTIRDKNSFIREQEKILNIQKYHSGVIKIYKETEGFGFISPNNGGSDIYLNKKHIRGSVDIKKGDTVQFVLREGDKPWADSVTRLN